MMTKNIFLWILRLEGISLLLLFFVAMPLKYFFDMPLFTKYVGAIHGILFLAFISALLNYRKIKGWGFKKTALGFIASCLPFGTFIFERNLD